MSSIQQRADDTGSTSPLRWAVETVRNSLLLKLAVAGLVLILLGYIINYGVWAAILPTWGTALVLLGVLGYAFVWWKRQ